MIEEKEYLEKIKSIRKHLKEHLNEERYEHSISVSFSAANLAMAHGYDLQAAEIAGLCHDCAKFMGKKDLIAACEREHIPLLPEYIAAPQVLHGMQLMPENIFKFKMKRFYPQFTIILLQSPL